MEKMIIDNDTFFADVLQMLDQGKRVTIPVKGYSMLPFIRGSKDLVVLEKADGNLRADDIVLFHLILFIYRHLPWNRRWIKENRNI